MSLFGVVVPQISWILGLIAMISGAWFVVVVMFFYSQIGGLWRSRVVSLLGFGLVLVLLCGLLGIYLGLLFTNPAVWWLGIPVIMIAGPFIAYGLIMWVVSA